MVYLARFKQNCQVIKARQIIRARKDKKEKTCTAATEGGLDSEMEVSEEGPDDEDERVIPKKGEKQKRIKIHQGSQPNQESQKIIQWNLTHQ